MKKWLIRISIILVVLAAVGGGVYYKTMRDMGFFREPVYETVRPDIPPLKRPAIFVFSKTNGFIHKDAIPAAQQMLRRLAEAQGWTLYFSDNGAVHNDEDLAKFDAIVWNNVSGDVLTADQRVALQRYIENGGGFVGLHASGGDPEYKWSWYPERIIGAQFIGHPMHPQFQRATLHVEAPRDEIMQGGGDNWTREDEWYSFASSPRRAGVQVLATLDERTYSPEFFGRSIRMGDDHPIIWKHCLQKGRVFYSALGHTAATYDEPRYISIVQHAVAWAAGLEGSGCAVNAANR